MNKIIIKTKGAPKPLAKYSQGIKIGDTLYIQGVIALDPETNKLIGGDITTQATRVFESIKAIVETAGMKMSDIVKITAFLANLEDYPGFNEVYNKYFTAEAPPVRTTVQAKMPLGALLEVEAIACKV